MKRFFSFLALFLSASAFADTDPLVTIQGQLDSLIFLVQALCIANCFTFGLVFVQLVVQSKNQRHLL